MLASASRIMATSVGPADSVIGSREQFLSGVQENKRHAALESRDGIPGRLTLASSHFGTIEDLKIINKVLCRRASGLV